MRASTSFTKASYFFASFMSHQQIVIRLSFYIVFSRFYPLFYTTVHVLTLN